MYQSAYHDRSTDIIHIWDDEKGKIQVPYQKYAYQVDSKGEFITMDDVKVKKVTSWNKEAEKQNLVYEYDVNPLMRTLIDLYWESDDVSTNHRIMFFDIEVAKDGGKYSTPKAASNTVTSISYFLKDIGYICLILDLESKLTPGQYTVETTAKEKIEVKLFTYQAEAQLLAAFVKMFEKIRPTILSGWNINTYDVPYLINRIQQVLGKQFANKLSELGVVYTEDFRKRDQKGKIAGVSILDYLDLYKKFTPIGKPRYTLDFISKLELGRGKKKYEGSLDDLYRNDIHGFIEYNVDDVELVVAMDQVFDYIDAAQGLCHAGHVPYEDFIFSSRYLEGASLTYCKRNNMIAMKTVISGEEVVAKGAFVKLPKPGLYKYIFDEDLSGMYPANIMGLNISPETKWGRVENFDGEEFSKDTPRNYLVIPKVKTTAVEEFSFNNDSEIETDNLRQFLIDKNLSISGNGILYRKDKPGLIPSLLMKWSDERKEYRKLAEKFKLAGDHEKYKYYDRKQYRVKILGNSFYGYLLLHGSRFYDLENGEATTQTGVQLLKQTIKICDWYYNKKLGTLDNPQNYVLYCDTDSVFLPALPLIANSNDKSEDELIQETLGIAGEIQSFVNKYYDSYAMKFHNLTSHRWNIKQELIGKTAFWGAAKKRYAMWIINRNGLPFDEPEIKGFDSVRSDFPQAFRDYLDGVIIDILHGKNSADLTTKTINFRRQYQKIDLVDCLPPSGVSDITKYKKATKSIPIHVHSSLNYNKLLQLLDLDGQYPEIDDGDKIVWGYLKENPYHFDTIAMRGYDDPPEIVEFLARYIDKDKIFNNSLVSKLTTIWEDLGWGQINLNENSEDFF